MVQSGGLWSKLVDGYMMVEVAQQWSSLHNFNEHPKQQT